MVSPLKGRNPANPEIPVILLQTMGGRMPNAYGDLTTLKSAAFLNAPDDGQDERLLGMLETASRWIDGYCDRHFFTSTGERRFDGTGRVVLAVTDLVSADEVRVRQGSTGRWIGWNSGDWLAYPLNAAPTEPDRRPYTRIVVTAGGRRFPLSRGGVIIAGLWGYGDVREDTGLQVSGAEAAAGDVEITVAASGDVSAPLSAGHTVRIGDEQMYVTVVSDDGQGTITLAVQRGVNGTTPATHATNSGVSVYRYPSAVTEACLQQAALWWRERLGAPFLTPESDGRGDAGDVSPAVRTLLKPYRRRAAALGV
ncbi:MAG: hypothetical protein OXL37_04605 [Chloroflexota bacterium]|nr:hypothetical protein [Chloroflexota bacterium]MDE2960992.1 hypothetical protein [Chloroflexota bacterium]